MNKKYIRTSGFTTVELLIVVVVIAILAAITAVSYNGIVTNSQRSSIMTHLRQLSTKIAHEKVTNDSYPDSLPESIQSTTDGTGLIYTKTNKQTFCLSAHSIKNTNLAFSVTESGEIKDGCCPGHEVIPPTSLSCFRFRPGTYGSSTIEEYFNNEHNNYSNPQCPRKVNIPSTIDGSPVKTIAAYAFSNKNLTAVSIPSSVNTIQTNSFRDNRIKHLAIPDSVKRIESGAFRSNLLESAVIPNSVIHIGDAAFNNNLLPMSDAYIYARNAAGDENKSVLVSYGGRNRDAVAIPETVVIIGSYALSGNKIRSVNIPSSVSTINAYAFAINNLSTVTIPESVVSIGENAFTQNNSIACSIPAGKVFANAACVNFTYY